MRYVLINLSIKMEIKILVLKHKKKKCDKFIYLLIIIINKRIYMIKRNKNITKILST